MSYVSGVNHYEFEGQRIHDNCYKRVCVHITEASFKLEESSMCVCHEGHVAY